MPDADLD